MIFLDSVITPIQKKRGAQDCVDFGTISFARVKDSLDDFNPHA